MEKMYLIYAGTGCTCCNDDNHYRGPYKTKEDAERRISYYYHKDSKYWPLASQFASRGHYSVKEIEIERLPDGRYILDGSIVVSDLNFIIVNEKGIIENDKAERYYEYD